MSSVRVACVERSTFVSRGPIAVTWEGGKGGGANPPQYFFILGILFITELNSDKQKAGRKKESKNLRFVGPIFPSFKFYSCVKKKFLIPMANGPPPPSMLLAK
jgi:hypothetical protein